MNFDYNVIATALLAPVAVLIIKTILDLSLAHQIVKYFFWLPVRGLFRDHPPDLAGRWEQTWQAVKSPNFGDSRHRHSYTTMRQFGRYLYSEFEGKGRTYCLFAKIRNQYVVGDWYDKNDRRAYFGALQLRIVNSDRLEGLYIGHSSRSGLVEADGWHWQKNGQN